MRSVWNVIELYATTRSMDALFDDGINVSTSTVRTVWNEIAENIKRGECHIFHVPVPLPTYSHACVRCGAEAGIHQALLETLDTQVIGPLNTFKVCGVFVRGSILRVKWRYMCRRNKSGSVTTFARTSRPRSPPTTTTGKSPFPL